MTELQETGETGESLVAEGLTFGSGDAGGVLSHPLPDELVELIAERFRVLSEPTRIKLLERLGKGEASVLELTDLIGTTQQNVSKHLGVLQRAGIVARRKQGNFAYYRIVDEAVFSLCEVVCSSLQQQVESRYQLLERR